MRAVGLKVLKNKLSEYVRLARDGETVLVTDRDRIVAELGPPRPEHEGRVGDALLSSAYRKRWIRGAVVVDGAPPARAPVAPLRALLDELDRDRHDR